MGAIKTDQRICPTPNIDLATLLIPYKGITAPEGTTTQSIDPANAGYGKIVFRSPDGATDEIYWKRRLCFALDKVDDLLTDSAFIHLHKAANGSLLKAFIFEGSFLAPYSPLRPSFARRSPDSPRGRDEGGSAMAERGMSRWLDERATFAIGGEGKIISSTRRAR